MHADARLTVHGRLLLGQRIDAARPAAHVAAEMGISRASADKWHTRWHTRWRSEGAAGLADRSSRPRSSPTRSSAALEAQVLTLRTSRRLGPAGIGGVLGLHPSTVGRVLARHHDPRLAWSDRPTGQVIRRYEHPAPGDLVHVGVKKLGRLREGGGWRMLGQQHAQSRASHAAQSAGRSVGYEYLHVAVDTHSRLAYLEALPVEQGVTAAAFWARAQAWLGEHGITTRRVLTDNGAAYRSRAWAAALAATDTAAKRTRTYRPQTNGKVEHFNRTITDECLDAATYTSSAAPWQALATGCTPTTTTAPTPPSADNRPSAAATTSQVKTTRRLLRVEGLPPPECDIHSERVRRHQRVAAEWHASRYEQLPATAAGSCQRLRETTPDRRRSKVPSDVRVSRWSRALPSNRRRPNQVTVRPPLDAA